MLAQHLVEAIEALGCTVEALPRSEARRYFAAWCEAFCGPVKARFGKYRWGSYHWHAFSGGVSPSESRKRAFDLYRGEEETELIIIPERWEGIAGLRISGCASPDLTPTRLDLHVFPESLAWTMAFTHEQPDLGPYFTRKEWCSSVPAA